MTYLVECCDHGDETIDLSLGNGAGKTVSSDAIKVVLNVDRAAGNKKPDEPGAGVRFRVYGQAADSKLAGMEGKIVMPTKAKVNYAPKIRMIAATSAWFGVTQIDEILGVTNWMQTGVACQREIEGNPQYFVYCEARFKSGDNGRYFKQKLTDGKLDDWPTEATYKVAVTDLATGKLECYLDGKLWTTTVIDEFKNVGMNSYSMGSEMFQSVDQCPGLKDDKSKCVFSDAQVLADGKWKPTEFAKANFVIIDNDELGRPFPVNSSHEWEYSDPTATGFKFWDKLVEY